MSVFIEFLSIYPDDKLFLYGISPEKSYIQNFIEDNKVEKTIIIKGFEKDKAKIYSNIDVLIHPSFVEGAPNVILEAMCSQAFVIASNVLGNRDMVDHEVTVYYSI